MTTTPITKPQGPTHPAPTRPGEYRASNPNQPRPGDSRPDTDPGTNPRPGPSRWTHAAIGLAAGCALAVVGLLVLIRGMS